MQPARGGLGLLGLLGLLALACRPAQPPPEPARPAADAPPLADADFTAALELGAIHWRRDDGTCERWELHPTPDAPQRGRLDLRVSPSDTLSYAYALADGHVTLAAPRHDAEDRATSLPCVFAGAIETRRGAPPQVRLDGRERWYLDAARCEADAAPDTRPLGCAAVLTDPGTRARLVDAPPATPAGLDAWLAGRGRTLYWLHPTDDGWSCERWRRRTGPGGPAEGALSRHHGDVRIDLDFALTGPWLTLAGPTWSDARGDASRVITRGCLMSQVIRAADRDHLSFEAGSWHRSRRACEAARARAAAPASRPPPCLTAAFGPPPTTAPEGAPAHLARRIR